MPKRNSELSGNHGQIDHDAAAPRLANGRGLAAELEALAFVVRRYPVAPTHPTGGASGEGRSAVGVGKVGESRLVDAEVAAAG
jgi:hypothetical protein